MITFTGVAMFTLCRLWQGFVDALRRILTQCPYVHGKQVNNANKSTATNSALPELQFELIIQ